MDDVGRKLNAERGAKVEALARAEIECWEESRSRSDEAKQAGFEAVSDSLSSFGLPPLLRINLD